MAVSIEPVVSSVSRFLSCIFSQKILLPFFSYEQQFQLEILYLGHGFCIGKTTGIKHDLLNQVTMFESLY